MEEEEVQIAHGLSNARGPLQEEGERIRMGESKGTTGSVDTEERSMQGWSE